MDIAKIKNTLKGISDKTQKINHHLIFDLIDKRKFNNGILNFLKNTLPQLSEDNPFYESEKVKNYLASVDISQLQITFDDFIVLLNKIIEKDSQSVIQIFKKELSIKSKIYKFESVFGDIVYPFYDAIFFIETEDDYLLFCIGYAD